MSDDYIIVNPGEIVRFNEDGSVTVINPNGNTLQGSRETTRSTAPALPDEQAEIPRAQRAS
jgi:hypothetical protein